MICHDRSLYSNPLLYYPLGVQVSLSRSSLGRLNRARPNGRFRYQPGQTKYVGREKKQSRKATAAKRIFHSVSFACLLRRSPGSGHDLPCSTGSTAERESTRLRKKYSSAPRTQPQYLVAGAVQPRDQNEVK